MYDLRGGVSQICCFTDIIEKVPFGDELAPVLQVVAVSGEPGQIIEKKYETPMFCKVNVREIDEIGIEIGTLSGQLVPFDYGIVVVVLVFKKLIVF